jgi:hypothetical protein
MSYEEAYNKMQDDEIEIVESNKMKLQDSTESLQHEVDMQVSQVSNMQIEESMPIQVGGTEEQEKEQDQEDAEMNERGLEYNEIIEETKEQTGERREVEKEIDIVRIPLEESIWAPSKRNCNQNNSLSANIPAHNVPGKTKEERLKFIRWSLRNNVHVKDVKEVFKRGNLWVEVDFDCEYGRNEAVQRISKKENDWYKIIPEEEKEDQKRIQNKHLEEYQIKRNKVSKAEEKKTESRENKNKTIEDQHEINKEAENGNYLTIWDLPADINKKELEYICRRFRKAQIIKIKRSKHRALAIIQVEETCKVFHSLY